MLIRSFKTLIVLSCLFYTLSTAHLIPRQASGPGGVASTEIASTTALANIGAGISTTPASSSTANIIKPSPTLDIGLGFWQLRDSDETIIVGNRITHSCQLTAGESYILDCKSPYLTIGNTFCVDLNGRRSFNFCSGILTVDFPTTLSGPTYIHYTAIGKSSGASCINNEFGEGSFGSPGFVGDWCVADITQYQKADPGTSESSKNTKGEFGYAISIYDSATDSTASDSKNGRNLIASTKDGSRFYSAAQSAVVVNFDGTASKLPGSFSLTSGNVDSDPYILSYANPYLTGTLEGYGTETFNAYGNVHQCSLADVYPNGGQGNTWGYQGGKRLNTCGFKC